MGWYNHDGNFEGDCTPSKKPTEQADRARGWRPDAYKQSNRRELLNFAEFIRSMEGGYIEKQLVYVFEMIINLMKSTMNVEEYEFRRMKYALEGYVGTKTLEFYSQVRKWRTPEDVFNHDGVVVGQYGKVVEKKYFDEGQCRRALKVNQDRVRRFDESFAKDEWVHLDGATVNAVADLVQAAADRLDPANDLGREFWNPATSQWQSKKPE